MCEYIIANKNCFLRRRQKFTSVNVEVTNLKNIYNSLNAQPKKNRKLFFYYTKKKCYLNVDLNENVKDACFGKQLLLMYYFFYFSEKLLRFFKV